MNSKEYPIIKPNDLLILNDREWLVTGVYLGALNFESVVSVRPLRIGCPSVDGKRVLDDLLIPHELLCEMIYQNNVGHYRLVNERAIK